MKIKPPMCRKCYGTGRSLQIRGRSRTPTDETCQTCQGKGDLPSLKDLYKQLDELNSKVDENASGHPQD